MICGNVQGDVLPIREHGYLHNGYIQYKKYRVHTLSVTERLPAVGPYFCPAKSCNYLAISSVEMWYHLTEHKTQLLSNERLAHLFDNIHKQINLFAETSMHELEM
jgi:hypothetical protein